VIVPEKPLRLVRVTITCPVVPAEIVMEDGEEEILKSVNAKMALAEWDRGPLAPFTATV